MRPASKVIYFIGGYTLMCNQNSCFGGCGNNSWIIILILLLLFGCGGCGNGCGNCCGSSNCGCSDNCGCGC